MHETSDRRTGNMSQVTHTQQTCLCLRPAAIPQIWSIISICHLSVGLKTQLNHFGPNRQPFDLAGSQIYSADGAHRWGA